MSTNRFDMPLRSPGDIDDAPSFKAANALWLFVYVALYAVGAWFGHWLLLAPKTPIALWFPSGLYLAALLLNERHRWPLWIVASLPADMLASLQVNHFPLTVAFGLYLIHTAEALIAALLIRHWHKRPLHFDTLEDVFILTAFGAAVSPGLNGILSAAVLQASSPQTFVALWSMCWIGDAVGVLLVAPLTLEAYHYFSRRSNATIKHRLLEATLMLVLFFGVAELTFASELPFNYVMLLPLLWAAMRFEVPGVSVTLIGLAVIAIHHTVAGQGLIASAQATPMERSWALQLNIAVLALAGLILAALSRQHRRAFNELEERAHERSFELQQSDMRLHLALDAADAGVWEYVPECDEFIASYKVRVMHGLPLNIRLRYQDLLATLHIEDRPRVEAALIETQQSGAPLRLELRVPQADGTQRWLLVSAELRSRELQARFIGLVQDITEAKQRDEALRQSRADLDRAQQVGQMGWWRFDVVHKTLYWSREIYRIFGVAEGTPQSYENFLNIVHPEDRIYVTARWKAALHGAPYDIEHRILVNGQVLWVREKAYLDYARDGTLIDAFGITQDITQRKDAEEALYQSRSQLQHLLDHIPAMVYMKDLDGRYLIINRRCEELFGISSAEALGRTATELLPAGIAEQLVNNDLQVLKTAAAQVVEETIAQDEASRTILTTRFPIRDASGPMVAFGGVAFDITERKRTEQALAQSQARLTWVLQQTGVGLWLNELPLQKLNWDDQTRHLFFLPKDAVPTIELFYSRIHPDDREPTRTAITNAISEQRLYEIDHRAVNPETGEVRWIRSSGQATYTDAGIPLRFDGINYDITDRKIAETALRESELRERQRAQELQTIFETAPIGLALALDPEASQILANRAMQQMLGSSPSTELFQSTLQAPRIRVLKDGRELPVAALPLQRAGRGETVTEESMEILCEEGRKLTVFGRAAPLFDESGRPRGAVGAFLDISPMKQAEDALREGDRRKDEFLATLAHELRNPLAPLRNVSHLFKRSAEEQPALAPLAAMMDRQVEHLVRLVDDLLEISRITRGKIELRKEHAKIQDILAHALETSRPLIDSGNHQLGVTIPAEPLYLDADPVRLAQVFTNLLNNAAKFTPAGGSIELSVDSIDTVVNIRIRDSGEGIPHDMLPSVFDLFTQIGRTANNRQGGLGIGLALARRLVELHEGHIEAHSAGPGCGSEFSVSLPLSSTTLKVGSTQKASAAVDVQATLGRILIVDDNHDVANSLDILLSTMGVNVETVYDGYAAINALDSFNPEVVLLDLGMPGMDGYETAGRIRQHPNGRDILLIALTGWGQAEDRNRTKNAGFDHHLVKPVDIDLLATLLGTSDSNRQAQSFPGSSNTH